MVVEYARSFFPVRPDRAAVPLVPAEPFKIPSGSMMPTLLVGDFILVNKFAYGLRLPVLNTKILAVGEPKRGDVFVFRYPENPKEDYIKRVIGLPGDEITYRNKTPVHQRQGDRRKAITGLYGSRTVRAATRDATAGDRAAGRSRPPGRIRELPQLQIGHEGTWKVPDGYYFAMGDNRDNSHRQPLLGLRSGEQTWSARRSSSG